MKLESPGVSSRLTLRSCHSKLESAAEIDIWRDFSSGSESDIVVPSVTAPSRLTAPPWKSNASCRLVLPLPRWPTSATLRMRSAALCMPDSSLYDAEVPTISRERRVAMPWPLRLVVVVVQRGGRCSSGAELARSWHECVLFRYAVSSHAAGMSRRRRGTPGREWRFSRGVNSNAKLRVAAVAAQQNDQILRLGLRGVRSRWMPTGICSGSSRGSTRSVTPAARPSRTSPQLLYAGPGASSATRRRSGGWGC